MKKITRRTARAKVPKRKSVAKKPVMAPLFVDIPALLSVAEAEELLIDRFVAVAMANATNNPLLWGDETTAVRAALGLRQLGRLAINEFLRKGSK